MNTEEKCWELTTAFEGNGWGGLTGNFDGQGWSAFSLSWATGQGTLQPLVQAMHAAGPETFSRCCTVEVEGRGTVDLSSDLLAWCAMPVDEAVVWAAARCQADPEKHPLPHWRDVFENLGAVEGFRAVQRAHGSPYMAEAHRIYEAFSFTTERGLALAFDIAVQDGSVRPEARAVFGASDPGRTAAEEARLVALAKAVAAESLDPVDVRSRKLCIALGSGVVHGQSYDLAEWPGLTLAPAVA